MSLTDTEGQSAALWRGSRAQKLRLASGLVLFAFAFTHFLNHALGLVSLDAMLAFEHQRVLVTRSWLGGTVLTLALLAHVALGLWTALRRQSWAMPAWQWLQIVTGLAIPVLLLPHIVNTRIASLLFGVHTDYSYELARIWPAAIITQTVLMAFVWVHGCAGIHFWLRVWPPYDRARGILLALAALVPFAALAGVSVQGRAVEQLMAEPQAAAALKERTAWPDASRSEVLAATSETARLTYAVVVASLALASIAIWLIARGRRRIPVHYVGGPAVMAEPGLTLLELSRRHGVPHLSVCGGRGRCSTCRVLILNGGAGVSPPTDAERRTLRAIGAGDNIRLACQTVPLGKVAVMPLLKPHRDPSSAAAAQASGADGVERDLAVLFVDLRGFTALTERKLPFDVVFILNQFFATVGQPVLDSGGWIANYAGDGLIALFDDERGIAAACRNAILATVAIDRAMAGLSARLLEETRAPLSVAMGLHAGPHVMGRVGYGATQPMSVVGLAINVASRLETLAKQNDVQLALSETVARFGSLTTEGLTSEPMEVRGLSEPLEVVLVPAARDLVPRLRPEQSGADLAVAAKP